MAVLRPKDGWMRQQLRYLVPAAAAAALVVMVVRYGGMNPLSPTPAGPPAASEPAAPVSAGQRMTKAGPESRATKKAESTEVARHIPEESNRLGEATHAPSPSIEKERIAAAEDRISPRMQAGRKKMADAAAPMAKEASPASPCETARTLAGEERWRDAEAAQRACLTGDVSEPEREKGLVFLAELLDRQARFADADTVIAEVDRQFPGSRPLDLYRQRRPMVRKRKE